VLAQLTYALFDDLEMPGQKALLECAHCGMLFDDVQFSNDQLQEYYRRNEHYASSSTGGSGCISDETRARYLRIIDLLEPGPGDLILDFGCGQGGFISECLRAGLSAVGIEPSAKSRAVARGAGLHVYESMDDFVAKNLDRKVKSVVFSHVLEHLLNPASLVCAVSEHACDASVYIEVPDAGSYLSPRAIRWPEMHFEHLSHFRKRNFEEFVRRCGIEIRKEGEIPFSELQTDIRCQFIVGRFTQKRESGKPPLFSAGEYQLISLVSNESVRRIMMDHCSLALWGVSQYAMLLLGSCAEIAARVGRIFDSSPAKVGRSIKGVVVEPFGELGTLTDDITLLIPRSNSLREMRSLLERTGFKGSVVEF
jgi:SAM-dependent methyltransferase